MDDFWLTMETEAIEQAAFPANIPITRVDASIIAPFIPPLMRSATVINTEKDKVSSRTETPSGTTVFKCPQFRQKLFFLHIQLEEVA